MKGGLPVFSFTGPFEKIPHKGMVMAVMCMQIPLSVCVSVHLSDSCDVEECFFAIVRDKISVCLSSIHGLTSLKIPDLPSAKVWNFEASKPLPFTY